MNMVRYRFYFLGLIGIVLFMNLVGKLVPFNHELLFVIIFVYGLFIAYKNYKVAIDFRILIWTGFLVLYWLIAIIVLNIHGELGERSMSHLNIMHSFIALLAISWGIVYLKPNIDWFWYLIGLAALSSALLLTFEIQSMGWDAFIAGGRLGSAYLHPIKMGVFANTVFIIMLGSLAWAYRKQKVFFILWLLLLIIVFFAVVFSQTRQAWIGWPEAILAWSIYYYFLFKKSVNFRPIKFFLGVSFTLATIFIFTTLVAGEVFEKKALQTYENINNYLNYKTFESSLGHRLIGYEAALTGIVDNFWIGIGEERFRAFQTSETSKIALKKFGIDHPGIDYRHIHNQYLMSFLTKGIFGFLSVILLLAFLFWFFINGLRKSSIENKPIWIAGLVFTVAETLVFIFDSPLIRSDTAAHFLIFSNLLIAFSILTECETAKNKVLNNFKLESDLDVSKNSIKVVGMLK